MSGLNQPRQTTAMSANGPSRTSRRSAAMSVIWGTPVVVGGRVQLSI